MSIPVPAVGPLCPGCMLRDSGAEDRSSKNVFYSRPPAQEGDVVVCAPPTLVVGQLVRGGDVGQFGRQTVGREQGLVATPTQRELAILSCRA